MAEVLNVNPMWLMGFDITSKKDVDVNNNELVEIIIDATMLIRNDRTKLKLLFAYLKILNPDIPQNILDRMIKFENE